MAGEVGESLPVEVEPQRIGEILERYRGSDDCVVLDVREPEEYARGHIEGAKNINFYDTEALSRGIGGLKKDCTYIVYCKRGVRASKVRKYMVERGFPRVCSIQGGIDNWQAQGMPVVR